MTCTHLSRIDREDGVVCPFCNTDTGARPAVPGPIPDLFKAVLVPTRKSRRLEIRRHIRNVTLTLAPWLATAAGVTAFVFIVYFIEGATS